MGDDIGVICVSRPTNPTGNVLTDDTGAGIDSDVDSSLLSVTQFIVAGDSTVYAAGSMAAAERVDEALTEAFASKREAERLGSEREKMAEANETDRRQRMQDVSNTFRSRVDGVIAGVLQGAQRMSGSAVSLTEIAGRTSSLAEVAPQASATSDDTVRWVAAAADQIAGSLGEMARQVSATTRAVRDAAERANITATQVERLNEAAERIGTVVSLIQQIAQQTNLLVVA